MNIRATYRLVGTRAHLRWIVLLPAGRACYAGTDRVTTKPSEEHLTKIEATPDEGYLARTDEAPFRGQVLDIALKEWAATCIALERGLQILLLRKGGLRDEEGAFQLESPRFWLMPTFLHQDPLLVMPQHHELLRDATPAGGEGDGHVVLHLWAEGSRTWTIAPGQDEVLSDLPHIWTDAYLDVRRAFRPDEPVLCTALRVFRLPQPHVLRVMPSFLGCRSWIEIPALSIEGSVPILEDRPFAAALQHLAAQLA